VQQPVERLIVWKLQGQLTKNKRFWSILEDTAWCEGKACELNTLHAPPGFIAANPKLWDSWSFNGLWGLLFLWLQLPQLIRLHQQHQNQANAMWTTKRAEMRLQQNGSKRTCDASKKRVDHCTKQRTRSLGKGTLRQR
jgi:hypothetical protein